MYAENETITFGRTTWETSPMLEISDYGGAGPAGEANIATLEEMHQEETPYVKGQVVRLCGAEIRHVKERIEAKAKGKTHYGMLTDDEVARLASVLKSRPWIIMEIGHHGHKRAWVNHAWEAGYEALAALSDYPLLDDEAHSEVEEEWTRRDFEDYGHSDIAEKIEDGAWPVARDDFLTAIPDTLRKALEWSAFNAARSDGSFQAVTFEHASCYFHADDIAPLYGDHIREWLKQDQALFIAMHAAELNRHQPVLPLAVAHSSEWWPMPADEKDVAESAYYKAFEAGLCPQGLDAEHVASVAKWLATYTTTAKAA